MKLFYGRDFEEVSLVISFVGSIPLEDISWISTALKGNLLLNLTDGNIVNRIVNIMTVCGLDIWKSLARELFGFGMERLIKILKE